MENMNKDDIYIGDRGECFKMLIKSFLKRGKLKDKYINYLTGEEDMKLYDQAFTSPSVNETYNYEFLEILGDATANKAIVWYLSKRFPQLNCTKGIGILSRLKINYISKASFSDIAEKLNFWPFITATQDLRRRMKKKLLTDVLEALIAAVEENINKKIRNGVGYAICYNIIEYLFNELDISLKYDDLYDPKTRLKETIDYFSKELKNRGEIKYNQKRENDLHYVEILLIERGSGRIIILGRGNAKVLKGAEQYASKQALATLTKLGFRKEPPEIFKHFCKA